MTPQAPLGAANILKLVALVDSGDGAIPDVARDYLETLIGMLTQLECQIIELDVEIAHRAQSNLMAHHLITVPRIGQLIASALMALASPPEPLRCGRDFAAWLQGSIQQGLNSASGRQK